RGPDGGPVASCLSHLRLWVARRRVAARASFPGDFHRAREEQRDSGSAVQFAPFAGLDLFRQADGGVALYGPAAPDESARLGGLFRDGGSRFAPRLGSALRGART